MKLLLIRHSITRANAAHLYCGSTDLPLTSEGESLAASKHYPPMDRYVTSGMKRTNRTMELVYPGLPYEQDAMLREMDFGVFEKRSYEELKDDPAYLQWISGDNVRNRCPGGESGEESALRAVRALERLAADGIDTAVVTHGGVIAGALAKWFPEAGKNRYEWQPKPADAVLVTFEGGKPITYENSR